MPTKDELRHAIQSRRIAKGLGYLALPKQDPVKQEQQLTPEEEERRCMRRARNKIAASKCRMRRRERLDTLLKMAEELESMNEKVEAEIAQLRAEKDALVAMLSSHSCIINPS